jgi:Retroviral aspartyl protease
MESATDSQFKKLKGQTRLPPYSNHVHPKPNSEKTHNPPALQFKPMTIQNNPKFSLIEQRRALSQCFRCGHRYFPGHQCKIKLQMLIGQQDPKNIIESPKGPVLETNETHEEAIVSMHVTAKNPVHNTMRFQGVIGNLPMFALIDSGSTHSFVNPSILQEHIHTFVATNLMIIMVAKGERMVTDSKCEALQFSIQGNEFSHDLRLLPVTGYDVILRLD